MCQDASGSIQRAQEVPSTYQEAADARQGQQRAARGARGLAARAEMQQMRARSFQNHLVAPRCATARPEGARHAHKSPEGPGPCLDGPSSAQMCAILHQTVPKRPRSV